MVRLRYKYILVDLSNLYARAFFTRQNETFLNQQNKEVATGGITGGIAMLKNLKRDYLAEDGEIYILVDSHGNSAPDELHPYENYRKSIMPQYKGTRKEKTDAYKAGIPVLKNILLSLGAPYFIIEVPSLEADDLVKPLLKLLEPKEFEEAMLLTNDEDWSVNITENVIWKSEQNGMMGSREFQEKMGFSPEKVILYKCIRGDRKSDNIPPGVPYLPSDHLKYILNNYTTLQELYANLDMEDHIPEKWKESIRSRNHALRINEKVIMPIPLDQTLLSRYLTASRFNATFLESILTSLRIDPRSIDYRLKSSRNENTHSPLRRRKLNRA